MVLVMPVVNVGLPPVVAKKMTFLPRNLDEFTTPEETYEALPENMAELRAEMVQKIDYAVSLGVFTNKEAQAWHDGFEACTEVEHMEELISVIDDFIDSGWAIVSEIEDLLVTDEISEGEKSSFLMQMDGMDYQDKIALSHELEVILSEVSRKRAKLKTILIRNDVDKAAATAFEREFGQADIQEKESVIERAGSAVKEQKPAGEAATSVRLRKVISLQIQVGNAKEARRILNSLSFNQLSYIEYVQFDSQITQLEIRRSKENAYKLAA